MLSGDLVNFDGLNSLAYRARHAAITDVAASFTKRRSKQLEAMAADVSITTCQQNPLTALQASPGGGKSTLLDMVGQLSSRGA